MNQILLITTGLFIIISCSTEKEDPLKNNDTSCLSGYVTTPCDLLNKAKVANYAGADSAVIEVKVPDEGTREELTQYSRIFCEYRWPSERVSTMTVDLGGSEIETEIPLDNVVSVGNIEIIEEDDLLTLSGHTETYAEYFHRRRIGNDNPNSESLSGIGEMASVDVIEAMGHSNYNKTSIWVLHGNVNFNIEVDVSDSDDDDLALAKQLALAVLENCSQ